MIKKLLIALGVKNMFMLYRLSKGYLEKEGWNSSVKRTLPINKNGQPIPWYTYPSIHFLEQKLHKELSVLEYGSGHSTIWFSRRVKNIISVEHNLNWYNFLKNKLNLRPNVEYLLKNLGSGDYQNEVLNYQNKFDIIVIDGRQRVQCILNSLGALKENGVIILDNSERTRYEEGHNFLISNGYKRIDFWGIGPLNYDSWATSVFYKEENCLNI